MMVSVEEFKQKVREAVSILESKGTPDELAEFFKSEGIEGGEDSNNCPIFNWLQSQLPADGNFHVSVCDTDFHLDQGDDFTAKCLGSIMEMPANLAEFINLHDTENKWGLDPLRPVGTGV